MTAAALPYLLAGAGTLAQMKSTADANDKRRSILNAQLDRDDAAAKKSNALILNESEKFAPEVRKEAMIANEEKLFGQQQADLQSGAGGGELGAITTAGGAGNVSDDFLRAKADRAVTEGNRLTSIARELAKTRAPGQLAIDEGYSRGNLSSELSNIAGTNQNYARAASNDAGAVQEGNLGAFGKIASAIGMGMAAGGAAKAAGAAAGGGTGIGFKVPSSMWG